MAEFSMPFKSIGGDRAYTADQYVSYFRNIMTDGIFNGGTNLEVTANDTDLISRINTGAAWVRAYYYNSDSEKQLTHDSGDLVNDRIDRIVVRLNLDDSFRNISTYILKGTPAPTPIAPALTRTNTYYELSLAQVLITAGASIILNSNITDERLDNSLCGLVNSLISVDAQQFQNEWDSWFSSKTDEPGGEFYDEWKTWFDSVVGGSYLTKANADTYYRTLDFNTSINSNTNAVNKTTYLCDTSSGTFTLTLPISPIEFNYIEIIDYKGTFKTNNLTIDGNGKNIKYNDVLNGTLDLDINNIIVKLLYDGVNWGLL